MKKEWKNSKQLYTVNLEILLIYKIDSYLIQISFIHFFYIYHLFLYLKFLSIIVVSFLIIFDDKFWAITFYIKLVWMGQNQYHQFKEGNLTQEQKNKL